MLVEVYEDGEQPVTVQLVDDGIVEVIAEINVGIDGRSIVSVVRTSGTGAAGTTDTYTITYTTGPTSTFTVLNGANGAVGATGQPPGLLWNWSTSTVVGDPGSGLMRNTASGFLMSETDASVINAAAFLGTLGIGDLLHIQTVANDVQIYSITGTPVDNGTWWTIPATQIALRGTFTANEASRVTRVPRGLAGRGVSTILRTSGTGAAGTTDTYTITYSDSTTSTFTVVNGANGRSVNTIARTSGTGAAGTTDTYTITYSDSTTSTFTVLNGANGRSVNTIARTTGTGAAGATDTYTITYSDSTTSTYTITNGTNGRAVTSIARTSGTGAAGTTDTYTITYSDSTTSTFTVTHGTNGTGTGDVVGPASAVDARVATYSGTTGKLIADGGATVANIRDRTTHTGAQAISTVTSLQTTLDAKTPKIAPTTGTLDSKYFRDVLVWSNNSAGAVNDNILITTPITASNTMFTIRIRGYYFLTGKSVIDLTVSGYYNSSPGINNASQINNGTSKLQATAARNPTTGLLDIVLSTLDGGQFGYPKIVVDAMLGHTLPPDSFGTGWSAVRSTTAALPAYTVSTIPTLIDPVARANHTGTQSADTLTDGTTNKAFLATERTKLTGVATGATANDTDANLRDRTTHTGTQALSTITGTGDAAAKNTGTTTGTVAAGDDARFLGDARATDGGLETIAAFPATTGTVTLDGTTGSVFHGIPTGAITLAFSNLVTGKAQTFTVEVNQGATAYAVTVPTGTIKWFSPQPVQAANKTTIYTLYTRDAGTTWNISAAVQT